MTILIVAGTILFPVLMFLLRERRFAPLFDALAALAVLLANVAAALGVWEIKSTHTELTLHIHEIFLDPLFLGTTGYIGLYSVYRLLVTTAHTWQINSEPPK
ncbi:MAG TPA: hypothetical protein VFV52_09835 [Bacilli bacterium]|nr:hypothetical protein [Bacilli bacterium]